MVRAAQGAVRIERTRQGVNMLVCARIDPGHHRPAGRLADVHVTVRAMEGADPIENVDYEFVGPSTIAGPVLEPTDILLVWRGRPPTQGLFDVTFEVDRVSHTFAQRFLDVLLDDAVPDSPACLAAHRRARENADGTGCRGGGPVVVVPFREQPGFDRRAQLERLLGRLEGMPVVVVEQRDRHLFHRGALLNLGFLWAEAHLAQAEFYIFHDCDLIPDDDALALYRRPRDFVCLAAVPDVRYRDAPTFTGGVTGVSPGAFRRMNGFPVRCGWGWGGEDDELRRRAEKVGLPWERNTRVGHFEDLEGLGLGGKLAWLRANGGKNQERYELKAQHAASWTDNGLNLVADLSGVRARPGGDEGGTYWLEVDLGPLRETLGPLRETRAAHRTETCT